MAQTAESQGERLRGGPLLSAISSRMVQIFSESYGKGPTKAKTYMFEDYVFCVLEDILTTVERTLLDAGHQDLIRTVRLTFQEELADRFTGSVEELTGRRVATYHSQVVFNPPMAFEIFVLEPEAGGAPA